MQEMWFFSNSIELYYIIKTYLERKMANSDNRGLWKWFILRILTDFWKTTSKVNVIKTTSNPMRFISEIYHVDLRLKELRNLGQYAISINPVALTSLVPRLFGEFPNFQQRSFLTKIRGVFGECEKSYFAYISLCFI